jgi:predicted nucleic acid-binding protein
VRPVYFDSSVFISIFMNDPTASKIKELLIELKREKIRVYTSIIAVQEVSVMSYRKGTIAQDNYSKIDKLARIEGITKDIALTAAKYEAHIIDQTTAKIDKIISGVNGIVSISPPP